MKAIGFALLFACMLAGCMNSRDEAVKVPSPSPASSAMPETITNSVKPSPTQLIVLIPAASVQIGESDAGVVYASQNKLYARNQDGIYKELGAPAVNKFSSSISADGSHLLYNRKDKKVSPTQVQCELTLLDVESGKETMLAQINDVDPCHSFGWLGNLVYVQWNEFPSRGLTDFTLFDGKSGTKLESGRLYQNLDEREARIVLLHSKIPFEERDGLESDIRIGALTNDGEFHLLFEQTVYEVQFLDIQLSESLGALAIWTHHVPANSPQLWMAPLDSERWSAGDWEALDIEPNPDGGAISYDYDGYVVLSDGRRFKLPWLE
jgi:hypothetical protein